MLWMLLGLFFLAVSCSDEKTVVEVSPLKITASDLAFGVEGGTRSVTVTSTTPIVNVTSSEAWCTTEITGDYTFSVTAEAYDQLNARHAVITVTDSKANEAHVSAIQTGMVFGIETRSVRLNDDGGALSVGALCSRPNPEVSSPKEWIEGKYVNDSLQVNVQPNTTGSIRSGWLYMKSGAYLDSMLVVQGEKADLVGPWRMYFTNSSTGKLNYLQVTIKDTGKDLVINWDNFGWSYPMNFNEEGLNFKLFAAKTIGTYYLYNTAHTDSTLYYVTTVLWDTVEGYLTWSATVNMFCQFQAGDDGKTVGYFEDNGSWQGYTVSALRLELFTSDEEISSTTRSGKSLLSMINPYLVKESAAPPTAKRAELAVLP